MSKSWVNRAVALLHSSLEPPSQELNELDWKLELSPNKQRLTEHLTAFANQDGGGFFAFGIDPAGTIVGVTTEDVSGIVAQISNLARNGIEPPVTIDHHVEQSLGNPILLVFVPEAAAKPVRPRSKSIEFTFIRAGGTTRKAATTDLARLLLQGKPLRWEDIRASSMLSGAEVLAKLDPIPLIKVTERPIPTSDERILDWLSGQRFIEQVESDRWYITNLGAIAAASRMTDFPSLERKAVRVLLYEGVNKAVTKRTVEGRMGYAIAFQSLMKFINNQLPHNHVIEQALRVKRTVYPEVALREIVANALIHQDFGVIGAGPLVEIYSDRIEVSNPGSPLPGIKLDRLIGTAPESRNELLAKSFRRYKICEEQGSGLIKAGLQVELYGLPPIRFEQHGNAFKVTLFSPRTFAQMSVGERIEACYQHSVLCHLSSGYMTNTTLRERLKMPERQRSMVSGIIQEALTQRRIKPADPENKSTKHARYVPYWA